MPRTKISKNSKRNRENIEDNKITAAVSKLDTKVANFIVEMELYYFDKASKITHAISSWKQTTPQYILNMTIKDLKETGAKLFSEIPSDQLSCTVQSVYSSDDGYITEASSNSRSVGNSQNHQKSMLANKSVRRSKSADNGAQHFLNAPTLTRSTSKNPPLLMPNKARMTPLSSHLSRSKFKTPVSTRIKAASADRYGVIRPKFSIEEPIAMLRYANVGETVVSVTGSPVVGASQGLDYRATVNIPIKNGIISLRPTELKSFDEQLVGKIDSDTLTHLKLLQQNLNYLTQLAENRPI